MPYRQYKDINRITTERTGSGPGTEPVSLSEIKDFVGQDGSGDDTKLTLIGKAAREMLEDYATTSFVTQDFKMTMDAFPHRTNEKARPYFGGHFNLPTSYDVGSNDYVDLWWGPLVSITHVKSTNVDGTQSTVSTDVYDIEAGRNGKLFLKSGQVWPTNLRPYAAVEIEYKAGFGTNATDVPSRIRQAILELAKYMYQAGGLCCEIPEDIKMLVSSEKKLIVK